MKKLLQKLMRSKVGRIIALEIALKVVEKLAERYPVYAHVFEFGKSKIQDEIDYLSTGVLSTMKQIEQPLL